LKGIPSIAIKPRYPLFSLNPYLAPWCFAEINHPTSREADGRAEINPSPSIEEWGDLGRERKR
jgi:hypothetical protein